MRNTLVDWIQDRTGLYGPLRSMRDEPLPAGPRWGYVCGSALLAILLIQAFTGLMMMTAYSASSSTAWGSVFYIEKQMWMGWFIRGLHHFGAQTVMVLLGVHLLQVLFAAAYRAPREVNWWMGLILMTLILAFSHTGYQLPWDQKGYWATKVVTNIMGGAPVLGPYVKTAVVGGAEYGNQTVTRFYGLHVGILPVLLAVVLGAHLALRYRHGLKPPANATAPPAGTPLATYFPDQTFRNSLIVTAILGVMVGLVLWEGGAPLDAPADPSSSDYPARPEWFFRFLFQMLKLFPGRLEWVGSIAIPGALMTTLALLPLLDKILPSKPLHFLVCSGVFALAGGAGYLTIESFREDMASESFREAREKADAATDRALYLAAHPDFGVPPEGASYLMRLDPLTRGSALLEKNCLGCHRLGGEGEGDQSAPDLKGFGSYAWVRGLLEKPDADAYFGKTPECDGMTEWKNASKLDAKQLDQVAEFVATFAAIPADQTVDEWLNTPGVVDHPGNDLFVKECGSCHMIDGYTEGGMRDAPDLFAWGSPRWMNKMIRKPGAADLYGFLEEKQRMPAATPENLNESDLSMIVRYLKDDYLKPEASSAARP
ncbi:cytochrome b N-terminal domain-containing protein [Planctomyces sp. SH-PL62]|uniref:cytochrome b N-terminal domain-containing protein n=1 Tax=Planctomyces sp. SH-PL62 TaxID=1636152 RepID=UPI00078DAE45|nr:cytochrome b N-terminal domain-containing protein [Planctomyces sp. SH-PL62]AMV36736.1 Menaquinol-cytochrome c reductase cytochrome b subunit [Planctomyces sp. SH-PL62]